MGMVSGLILHASREMVREREEESVNLRKLFVLYIDHITPSVPIISIQKYSTSSIRVVDLY